MGAFESHREALTPPTRFSRRGSAATISTDATGLVAGEVKIPVSDGEIPAYRAMPAEGGPFASVVVVHEIFGVHEHIKDICRRLGKAGYLAVAPALYARQGDPAKLAGVPDIIHGIVAKVPDAEVASDIDQTIAWMGRQQAGDVRRLGVTGFCWGGRQTWLYAVHNPQVKAAVAWYGPLDGSPDPLRPRTVLEAVPSLKVPVLGLYGGADPSIPAAAVQQLEAELKSTGTGSQIVIYPGAPHGFNADYRSSYRPEAAKDGWQRLLAWFRQHGVA